MEGLPENLKRELEGLHAVLSESLPEPGTTQASDAKTAAILAAWALLGLLQLHKDWLTCLNEPEPTSCDYGAKGCGHVVPLMLRASRLTTAVQLRAQS
jgi:hypothetical protein